MTDHFKTARDTMIETFKDQAAALLAAAPTRRSVMLAVSQFWNDSADDEVHGHVIASARATPVWPHECEYGYGDESNDYTQEQKALLAGEECWHCAGGDIDMSFYGGYGDATVSAFEVFCRESAHQGMEVAEAYIPFAIARRTAGDGVELEIVGHPQRTPTMTMGSAPGRGWRDGGAGWPDARARALFDEVCRHAADDAPRAVLADYMLEAHPDDPRGEAITLALARDLDADTRARRDALFADHSDRWMFPLGDVIAPGCAHFERGFLARVDVYAAKHADRDRVRDEPAWGTVHTIRFAPESCDVIAPAMVALRDVGPLRDDGVHAIARERSAWSIETLRIDGGDLRPLFRATNLPHLTELELSSAFREDLTAAVRKAPWYAQLRRLGFVASEYGSLADWRALRQQLGVPELSIAIAPYWSPLGSSWQLGFRADDSVGVCSAGWNGTATMLRLAELLGELPADTRIELISTPARACTDADVTWLREYTGRDVMLRA